MFRKTTSTSSAPPDESPAEQLSVPAVIAKQDNSADNRLGSGMLRDLDKPSVISEGFSLHGDIKAHGTLHIEGSVVGTIETDVVNIGPTGKVDGLVVCRSLVIKGEFVGEGVCSDLTISAKGRFDGNVRYRTLAVQRGANVSGELVPSTE